MARLVALIVAAVACLPVCVRADVGLEWLTSQQQPSGAIASPADIAIEVQSTSEALSALIELGSASEPVIAPARQFVLNDPNEGVESLARKIIAAGQAGLPTEPLVTALLAAQSPTGGFGAEVGFDASVLNTAHAVEALAAAKRLVGDAPQRAVSFLLARQRSDGSWLEAGNESSVILTSAAMRAAWLTRHVYNVNASVQSARTWLLSARDTNALWYGTYPSAAALHAIAPTLADASSIQASTTALTGLQLPNGSFENDVYVTALALRALGATQRQNPDKISIRGKVVDGDTRAPLADVTVSISGPSATTLLTATDGTFVFETYAAGTYRVVIAKAPYSSITVNSAAASGEAINFGEIPLLRSSAPLAAVLKGRVSDKVTNQAIAGATISVVERNLSATTDSAGNYEIGGITSGPATVMVAASGYASAQAMVAFSDSQIYSFSPQLVTLASSKVRVDGIVTDSSTNQPLEGVRVRAIASNGEKEALSGVDGRYEIADLDPGSLTVSASKDAYQTVSGTTNAPAGARIQFSPALAPINAPPAPVANGAVRVVVLDSVTGQMLSGVTLRVTVGSVARTANTNAEGFAQVDNVAGNATVQLTRSGYTTKQFNITIPAGVTVDLGQVELVSTTQGTGGGFRGIVRHGVTNALLGSVSIRGTFGTTVRTATSSSVGAFQVNNIPPADGVVELSRTGFETVTLRAILIAGEVIDLGEIYLRPTGTGEKLGDLAILRVDPGQAITDANSFAVSGRVLASTGNVGTATLSGTIEVLAFSDANANGVFDESADTRLGAVLRSVDLPTGATLDVEVPLSGTLPFRDAPVSVFVDSRNALLEQSESNNIDTSGGLCTSANKPAIDLALCLDSSGSISTADFQVQLAGTAAAVEDSTIIPRDGTVRLSVMQFSSAAQVEVAPTIIGADNFSTIASRIRGIRKANGGTSIHACVDLAWQTVVNASPATAVQVIDVSTDGGSSLSAAVAAANRASNAGIDALNALAVGAGADMNVLNAIVFPKTGGEGDGFVVPVANFQEYASALAGKIRRETRSADLTVGGLKVLDNGPGATLSATARVGNAGSRTIPAGETFALYRGAPEAGGVLLQELTLPRLDPGQSIEVRFDGLAGLSGGESLVVVADPNRSLAECSVNNNRHETLVATTLARISVTTDRGVYPPESAALITAVLTNTGAVQGDFLSRLEVLDADGSVVAAFGDIPSGTIAAGGTVSRAEPWNTGTLLSGDYRAVATVFLPSGQQLERAEAPFSIQHDVATGPSVTLRTRTDRQIYNTTDVVNIDDLVRNLTASTLLREASLDLVVTGPSGQVVLSLQTPLGDLAPGAVRQIADRLRLTSAELGLYTVRGRVLDPSGQILASDQTGFEVREDLNRSLSGDVVAQIGSLFRGETQSCSLSVTNIGTQPIDQLPIRLLSGRLDAEDEPTVVSERTIAIASGETRTFADSFDTDGLAAGDQACVLQAQIDGEWKALDFATYLLREPTPNLTGDVKAIPNTVKKGESLVCTDVARNQGDHSLKDVRVRQSIVRSADGQTVSSEESSIVLPRLGTKTLVRSVDTSVLEVGEYSCGLEAQVNGQWQTLDQDPFVVNRPIVIDASMELGERGRLLVLMDPPGASSSGGSLCHNNLLALGLELDFDPPLEPDALVQVKVLNSLGLQVDVESIRLAEFDTEVNAQTGGNRPVDAAIRSLGADHLAIVLRGQNTQTLLGSKYRVVTQVTSATRNLSFSTGLIDLACNSVYAVGDTVGDAFSVIGIGPLNLFGQNGTGIGDGPDASSAAAQLQFLEQLLREDGWSYVIETDAAAFAAELRSGGYTAYALLSEYVVLAEQVQKEVREAAYRGDGLLVAGRHDVRTRILDDALGIKYKGWHLNPQGVEILPSDVLLPGQSWFAEGDRVQRVRIGAGNRLGKLLPSGTTAHDTVIARNDYGDGRAVYAGFDLLAESKLAGLASEFADLIRKPLTYVQPAQDRPVSGRVVPVRLVLDNRSVPVQGRVTVTSSLGGYVVTTLKGTVSGGKLTYTFDLPEGGSDTIEFFVQLPSGGIPITLTAKIESFDGSEVFDEGSITLDLTPLNPPGIEDAVADLSAYVASQPQGGLITAILDLVLDTRTPARRALDHLNAANAALGTGNVASALRQLVEATDDLIRDGTPAVVPIRKKVDQAIFDAGRLQ